MACPILVGKGYTFTDMQSITQNPGDSVPSFRFTAEAQEGFILNADLFYVREASSIVDEVVFTQNGNHVSVDVSLNITEWPENDIDLTIDVESLSDPETIDRTRTVIIYPVDDHYTYFIDDNGDTIVLTEMGYEFTRIGKCGERYSLPTLLIDVNRNIDGTDREDIDGNPTDDIVLPEDLGDLQDMGDGEYSLDVDDEFDENDDQAADDAEDSDEIGDGTGEGLDIDFPGNDELVDDASVNPASDDFEIVIDESRLQDSFEDRILTISGVPGDAGTYSVTCDGDPVTSRTTNVVSVDSEGCTVTTETSETYTDVSFTLDENGLYSDSIEFPPPANSVIGCVECEVSVTISGTTRTSTILQCNNTETSITACISTIEDIDADGDTGDDNVDFPAVFSTALPGTPAESGVEGATIFPSTGGTWALLDPDRTDYEDCWSPDPREYYECWETTVALVQDQNQGPENLALQVSVRFERGIQPTENIKFTFDADCAAHDPPAPQTADEVESHIHAILRYRTGETPPADLDKITFPVTSWRFQGVYDTTETVEHPITAGQFLGPTPSSDGRGVIFDIAPQFAEGYTGTVQIAFVSDGRMSSGAEEPGQYSATEWSIRGNYTSSDTINERDFIEYTATVEAIPQPVPTTVIFELQGEYPEFESFALNNNGRFTFTDLFEGASFTSTTTAIFTATTDPIRFEVVDDDGLDVSITGNSFSASGTINDTPTTYTVLFRPVFPIPEPEPLPEPFQEPEPEPEEEDPGPATGLFTVTLINNVPNITIPEDTVVQYNATEGNVLLTNWSFTIDEGYMPDVDINVAQDVGASSVNAVTGEIAWAYAGGVPASDLPGSATVTLSGTGPQQVPPPPPVRGCINPDATNYNPDAEEDDGSCVFPQPEPEDTEPREWRLIFRWPEEMKLPAASGFTPAVSEGGYSIDILIKEEDQVFGQNGFQQLKAAMLGPLRGRSSSNYGITLREDDGGWAFPLQVSNSVPVYDNSSSTHALGENYTLGWDGQESASFYFSVQPTTYPFVPNQQYPGTILYQRFNITPFSDGITIGPQGNLEPGVYVWDMTFPDATFDTFVPTGTHGVSVLDRARGITINPTNDRSDLLPFGTNGVFEFNVVLDSSYNNTNLNSRLTQTPPDRGIFIPDADDEQLAIYRVEYEVTDTFTFESITIEGEPLRDPRIDGNSTAAITFEDSLTGDTIAIADLEDHGYNVFLPITWTDEDSPNQWLSSATALAFSFGIHNPDQSFTSVFIQAPFNNTVGEAGTGFYPAFMIIQGSSAAGPVRDGQGITASDLEVTTASLISNIEVGSFGAASRVTYHADISTYGRYVTSTAGFSRPTLTGSGYVIEWGTNDASLFGNGDALGAVVSLPFNEAAPLPKADGTEEVTTSSTFTNGQTSTATFEDATHYRIRKATTDYDVFVEGIGEVTTSFVEYSVPTNEEITLRWRTDYNGTTTTDFVTDAVLIEARNDTYTYNPSDADSILYPDVRSLGVPCTVTASPTILNFAQTAVTEVTTPATSTITISHNTQLTTPTVPTGWTITAASADHTDGVDDEVFTLTPPTAAASTEFDVVFTSSAFSDCTVTVPVIATTNPPLTGDVEQDGVFISDGEVLDVHINTDGEPDLARFSTATVTENTTGTSINLFIDSNNDGVGDLESNFSFAFPISHISSINGFAAFGGSIQELTSLPLGTVGSPTRIYGQARVPNAGFFPIVSEPIIIIGAQQTEQVGSSFVSSITEFGRARFIQDGQTPYLNVTNITELVSPNGVGQTVQIDVNSNWTWDITGEFGGKLWDIDVMTGGTEQVDTTTRVTFTTRIQNLDFEGLNTSTNLQTIQTNPNNQWFGTTAGDGGEETYTVSLTPIIDENGTQYPVEVGDAADDKTVDINQSRITDDLVTTPNDFTISRFGGGDNSVVSVGDIPGFEEVSRDVSGWPDGSISIVFTEGNETVPPGVIVQIDHVNTSDSEIVGTIVVRSGGEILIDDPSVYQHRQTITVRQFPFNYINLDDPDLVEDDGRVIEQIPDTGGTITLPWDRPVGNDLIITTTATEDEVSVDSDTGRTTVTLPRNTSPFEQTRQFTILSRIPGDDDGSDDAEYENVDGTNVITVVQEPAGIPDGVATPGQAFIGYVPPASCPITPDSMNFTDTGQDEYIIGANGGDLLINSGLGQIQVTTDSGSENGQLITFAPDNDGWIIRNILTDVEIDGGSIAIDTWLTIGKNANGLSFIKTENSSVADRSATFEVISQCGTEGWLITVTQQGLTPEFLQGFYSPVTTYDLDPNCILDANLKVDATRTGFAEGRNQSWIPDPSYTFDIRNGGTDGEDIIAAYHGAEALRTENGTGTTDPDNGFIYVYHTNPNIWTIPSQIAERGQAGALYPQCQLAVSVNTDFIRPSDSMPTNYTEVPFFTWEATIVEGSADSWFSNGFESGGQYWSCTYFNQKKHKSYGFGTLGCGPSTSYHTGGQNDFDNHFGGDRDFLNLCIRPNNTGVARPIVIRLDLTTSQFGAPGGICTSKYFTVNQISS